MVQNRDYILFIDGAMESYNFNNVFLKEQRITIIVCGVNVWRKQLIINIEARSPT